MLATLGATMVEVDRGRVVLEMPADREVLTVDFSATFTAPGTGERFRATATVLRSGRTIVVTRGDVHSLTGDAEPRLVAAMHAAMMAVPWPPDRPDVPAT